MWWLREMELWGKRSVQMYSSIVEKQMSFRRKLNAKFSEIYLSPPLIYMIKAIRAIKITKLTILIVVQVAFFSELTSSVSPAPANALLIGL